MPRHVRRPLRRSVVVALGAALATGTASPALAQFDGCTWERCAAQVVAAPFGARVAFGGDTIALGWRGTDVAARLSRAGDAAPHAARMVRYRTRGVPLAIAGTIATPFVLAAFLPEGSLLDLSSSDAGPSGSDYALLGAGVLVSTLGDIDATRGARELHHAVWRHNRQLALAIRRASPDSLAGELRGCTIERCGVRLRHRGGLALGSERLVQGDAGPQVDVNPFAARAVVPLFRGSAEAMRDAERWASRGRTAALVALTTVVASTGYLLFSDAPRTPRVLGTFGIAAVGAAIATPSAIEADRALQRAIWRLNGELAR